MTGEIQMRVYVTKSGSISTMAQRRYQSHWFNVISIDNNQIMYRQNNTDDLLHTVT